jgi:2-polyprenyl-3-methyl-5-hydroxy-6-metoxy-1,4-benzoquinol methylase
MTKIIALAKSIYRNNLSIETKQKLARLRARAKRGVRGVIGSLSVRCHVCRSKNVLRFSNPATAHLAFPLFICRDCNFIFVHPVPDLSGVYSYSDVPEFGEGESLWNARFLESIEKYAQPKGSLLEIGFGDASFLKLAHERGWEVHGVDLSPLFVRHASETLGLPNIKEGTIEGAGFPDNSFDVIAAFNFIEHVPDPLETLKLLRRLLRPEGTLALLCPNLSGIYHLVAPEIFNGQEPLNISWVPPMHLSYFNKSNFKRLLESAGFAIVADESHLTSDLWLQHRVTLGPQVTDEKLEQLLAEIRDAKRSGGNGQVGRYRARISSLLRDRMMWTMISDLMKLEPALGAENAVLYLSRKANV